MIQLNTCASLHEVLEGSQLVTLVSPRVAEVSLGTRSVFGVALLSEGGSGVVSLISIWSQPLVLGSPSFRQSPPGEVLLVGGLRAGLWNVSARAHTSRSRSLIFESLPSPESESVFLGDFVNWLFFGEVLWPWVVLQVAAGEPRLGSNLGCQDSRFPGNICFLRVVQE